MRTLKRLAGRRRSRGELRYVLKELMWRNNWFGEELACGIIRRKSGWKTRLAIFCALQSAVFSAQALTILSPPTVIGASNAPLAATLTLTTDVPSRVSVDVNDGSTPWHHDFLDFATVHSEMLVGFKAGQSNVITVTVTDLNHRSVTVATPASFMTAPLPSNLPTLTIHYSDPQKMEPGYTLFRLANNDNGAAYVTIVDDFGNVVWYSSMTSTLDVRQLANGNLFIPLTTNFVEVNLLGQLQQSWNVPPGYTIDFHDGVPTDHGTILYLYDDTRQLPEYPTSSTNPNAPMAPAAVEFNRVLEISAANSVTNTTLLNNWSLIDMLQPTRVDYLTFSIHYPALGWDSEHANAVIEDPRDHSIIVSLRHQDAVIKFTRDGNLKWILGPHENWNAQFQPYLLTPVGEPFEWNYAQHAPVVTPQGTLLLYDDGNFRASPFDSAVADVDNYSRAVEYRINEDTMEVSQVWDYGRTNDVRIFTDRVGNADWLPKTGNVLVNFGNVDFIDGSRPSPGNSFATILRILEVTHGDNSEVVFDLTASTTGPAGAFAYRSHRIPDLYGHPALPVADLTVEVANGDPLLQFSGDPVRSYGIEASTDLIQWHALGVVTSETADFSFTDSGADGMPKRYYRVVTK